MGDDAQDPRKLNKRSRPSPSPRITGAPGRIKGHIRNEISFPGGGGGTIGSIQNNAGILAGRPVSLNPVNGLLVLGGEHLFQARNP